jgi:hypothetical protein
VGFGPYAGSGNNWVGFDRRNCGSNENKESVADGGFGKRLKKVDGGWDEPEDMKRADGNIRFPVRTWVGFALSISVA